MKRPIPSPSSNRASSMETVTVHSLRPRIPPSRSLRTLGLALAAFLSTTTLSRAAFTLVDDFQSYTTGTAEASGSTAFAAGNSTTGGNGGPWSPVGGNATTSAAAVSIVDESGNKYLAIGGSNLGAKLTTVPDIADANTAATYFFQFRTTDPSPSTSFGLSDLDTVSGLTSSTLYANFEAQVALSSTNAIVYRNGATAVTSATTITTNTWVNVWMVINNSANTWDLYTSTGSDAASIVASGIGFRNGAATNVLTSFLLGSSSDNAGSFHIDNIYIDLTGENLINVSAVPEPSTWAAILGSLVLMVALVRRRRAD